MIVSTLDAWIMLVVLGYTALYARTEWHLPDIGAAAVAAVPGFAWFLGGWLWSHGLPRWGAARSAGVALGCYALLGLGIWLAPSAAVWALWLGVLSVGTSGLRPAVADALLHRAGSDPGRHLVRRVRWQSAGWLVGGVVSGLAMAVSLESYVWLLTGLGVAAAVAVPIIVRQPTDPPMPSAEATVKPRLGGTMPSILLAYFVAYCAIEGVVTTLGLLLAAHHVSAGWVGGSTTIRTAVGWALTGWYGIWADRWGARRFVLALLVIFTALFAVIAAASNPVILIAGLSVILNSPLTLGTQLLLTAGRSQAERAAALARTQAASGLAIGVGTLILGSVATALGPGGMIPAAAIIMLVAAVILAVATRTSSVHQRSAVGGP